jgi:hypothetical protein
MKKLAAMIAFTVLVAVPSWSFAAYTGQISAGGSYVFGGSSNRGPLTFEIGPGYQMLMVRVELPVVFAAGGKDTFPPTTGAFMGVRPSIKVFPWDPFYAKVSTQLFWTGQGHYGAGIGGGIEYSLLDLLGGFAEITVNPYFEKGAGTPVEARIGVILKI